MFCQKKTVITYKLLLLKFTTELLIFLSWMLKGDAGKPGLPGSPGSDGDEVQYAMHRTVHSSICM